VEGPAFAALQAAITKSFPGVIVAPYLVVGGTDARHYASLTKNVYRFNPFTMTPDAMRLAHGTDERISIANLATAVRFYRLLLTASRP
jgi:carboxypeptidase PM20D1